MGATTRWAGWLGAVALVVAGTVARADEWKAPQPKATARGAPVAIAKDRWSAATLPRGRVDVRHTLTWPEETHTTFLAFDATGAPGAPDAKGRPTFELAVELARMGQDATDVGPRVRLAGAELSLAAAVDEKGYVASGTLSGADRIGLPQLSAVIRPAGSWLVPYVPTGPLHVGSTWDLPLEYYLWSVGQPGDAPPKGFATQVIEAVEDHAGVPCARLRTVASIERPQRKGLTPPMMKLGEGDTLARIRGEATTWIGLDGCLREEVLDLHLRLENPATSRWMEWRTVRTVVARPATGEALPKDWTRMTGGRPVAVGYAAGLAEGKRVGRPLMCVVVAYGDRDSEALAFHAFHDEEVRKQWEGYLPVIVDREDLGDVPNAEIVRLLPTLLFVDLDGDVIFMMSGASPAEFLRAGLGAAATRRPTHEPDPAFAALRARLDGLGAPGDAVRDVKPAVATLLALRADGRGIELQAEVRERLRVLELGGQRRIDDAVREAAAAGTNGLKPAQAALAAIAADFAGLPTEARAKAAAATLGTAPPRAAK